MTNDDLYLPSETLIELYGSMYKFYPRQWVNVIGSGTKVIPSGVQFDLAMIKSEWNSCYTTKTITRKMSYILMYAYAQWIKTNTRSITGFCAEMVHNEIITLISKFYTVKLSEKTLNPLYAIWGLFTRVYSHVCYKLYANLENNKRHKYYQLRTAMEMNTTSVRHDLLTDNEGMETYVMNRCDFDWDFGARLDDAD